MSERITVHGITFIRTGQCVQCGACGCAGCPHHYEQDGLHWCSIYERRAEVCPECSAAAGEEVTHASCIAYPDNPWITNVRRGVCGYTFQRADGKPMDSLPFLGSQPYRLC